jgi:hypothetical protein
MILCGVKNNPLDQQKPYHPISVTPMLETTQRTLCGQDGAAFIVFMDFTIYGISSA